MLLILAMPTDIIIIMLAVGEFLVLNNLALTDAAGFALLTILIAALPLLGYQVAGERAEANPPRIRDWMNRKSWPISTIVYGFFIYAFLS